MARDRARRLEARMEDEHQVSLFMLVHAHARTEREGGRESERERVREEER